MLKKSGSLTYKHTTPIILQKIIKVHKCVCACLGCLSKLSLRRLTASSGSRSDELTQCGTLHIDGRWKETSPPLRIPVEPRSIAMCYSAIKPAHPKEAALVFCHVLICFI